MSSKNYLLSVDLIVELGGKLDQYTVDCIKASLAEYIGQLGAEFTGVHYPEYRVLSLTHEGGTNLEIIEEGTI